MKLRSSTAAALMAASLALPDSNPGRLLGDFLAHCRKAAPEDMSGWYRSVISETAAKRASAEERAGNAVAVCREDDDFQIGEIVENTPDSLKARLLGKKSGEWKLAILQVDPAGKLERGVALIPTQPAENALPKDLGDKAIAEELSRRVAHFGASGQFSGIAAVARGTDLIATASAGFADRKKKTRFTPDTQFTLGSLGKMFTAAAVGQLVDQGKLSFDDKVGKFFPDYPNRTVRDKVTLGMLMSHTSGMGDFLMRRTPAMMAHGIQRATELMPLYDQDEPAFEPGSQWAYSNAGLALMGAIVEKASGRSYADYIRDHVFKPAGMTRSDPNNIPHVAKELVTPYTRMSREGKPLPDWQEAERDIGSPAGGAISTVRDLARFADALRNGRLISKKTFELMATNHNPMSPGPDGYGYAMMINSVYGTLTFGHGGGFPGVNTQLTFLADSPYSVIVLANQDPPAAELVNTLPVAEIVEKAKTGQ
jgi:CubicO group peptidase (beta-lactamase class C family)